MSSDRALEGLVSTWKDQPPTGFRMVPSDFARRIRAEKRMARFWIPINLILFVLMILFFGSRVYGESDPFSLAGRLLIVLAVAFFVGQITMHMRRLRAARFDVDRTTAPSIASARAYLNTRREFHSGLWLWSRVIALLPGWPLAMYGSVHTDPDQRVWMPVFLLFWLALLAAIVLFVQWPAARHYERRLRELDDIERYSPLERYVAAHERWK